MSTIHSRVAISWSVPVAKGQRLVFHVHVFFRIARDANIPYDKIMDVGMFDVRYTKLFNSHYASKDKTMANMIYEAQKVRTRHGGFYIRFAFTSKYTYIYFLLTSKSKHNLFTSKSYLHPFLFTSISYLHIIHVTRRAHLALFWNTKNDIGLLRHRGSRNQGDKGLP